MPTSYRSGLKVYAVHRRMIRETIRRHNGHLHQDEFDNIFRSEPFPVFAYSDDAFILGNGTSYSMWLDLLNHMVEAIEILKRGRTPNLHYCLVKQKDQ